MCKTQGERIMAKQKYYAVRAGNTPGVYKTWAECERQTKGVSGAVFKSFATMEEAQRFVAEGTGGTSGEMAVEDINSQVDQKLSGLNEEEVVAFVDGSYDPQEEKSGFGAILIDHMGQKTSLSRAFTREASPEFLELRNVAAELEGVREAIKYAVGHHKSKITIYYDYAGIGNWADGSWQAKKDLTKQYVSFLNEYRPRIAVELIKVPAHSGVAYNEEADALAKSSLLQPGSVD